MGETLKEKTRSLKDEATKILLENGLMRQEDAEAVDPNYNRDEEVRKLREELAKSDLGKPASEMIIEDRR